MQQYRYTYFDNEEPDPPAPPTPHSRAMSAAYEKGKAAAGTESPRSPYKRRDFDEMWQTGFEVGMERLGRLGELYPFLVDDDIPL